MTEWGIDTLFNPGKRHLDEEKRRLQSTREEVGDSSGGRRIDLESGTVVIPRRKSGPATKNADDAGDHGAVDDGAVDDGAADQDGSVVDEDDSQAEDDSLTEGGPHAEGQHAAEDDAKR